MADFEKVRLPDAVRLPQGELPSRPKGGAEMAGKMLEKAVKTMAKLESKSHEPANNTAHYRPDIDLARLDSYVRQQIQQDVAEEQLRHEKVLGKAELTTRLVVLANRLAGTATQATDKLEDGVSNYLASDDGKDMAAAVEFTLANIDRGKLYEECLSSIQQAGIDLQTPAGQAAFKTRFVELAIGYLENFNPRRIAASTLKIAATKMADETLAQLSGSSN